MNRQLHRERIVRGTHRRRLHAIAWNELPTGVFVLVDEPALVLEDRLVEWTRDGYSRRIPRPARGDAVVITPPSTVAVLSAGYPVQIDERARRV
jgi:hypothetical protein